MERTGRVFDISRGCVEDGPGLRTVVFMKGCGLDCPWCHNPEGKSVAPEIAFDASLCLGCRKCNEACHRTWDYKAALAWRHGCSACGRCAQACPSGARRLVGREYRVEELVEEALEDAEFFAGTGGGVTFSGGEPLTQPEFLFDCAKSLKKRGVHVAVETSGFWPETLREGLVRWFDLVLFDLKLADPARFRKFLGKDNAQALGNLRGLLETRKPVELRLTLIPGFNDRPEDLSDMAAWLGKCPRIPELRVIPFHRLASSKAALFGREYRYAKVPATSREQLAEAVEYLRACGIPVIED